MKNEYEEEIDLIKLFKTLRAGKKTVILITIAAVTVAVAVTYLTHLSREISYTARSVIAYNYPGAKKGLNPSGGKLDVGKIRSPFLINRTLNKISLEKREITVAKIRNGIDIKPIIPARIEKRIEKSHRNGEDYNYFPAEYIIEFNVPRDLNLSQKEGRQILDALVDEYTDYFKNNYSQKAVFANLLKERDLNSYDYPEVARLMNKQINEAVYYFEDKRSMPQGQSFRAKSTGLAFSDIIKSLKLLQGVELNRMGSIISSYNLTKDRQQLIVKYQLKIEDLSLEKAKKEAELNIAVNMMNNFKEDNGAVLVSGMPESVLPEDQSKYYDQLAERATNAGVAAQSKSFDIQYYQREIASLMSDTVRESAKSEAIKKVQELTEEIKIKLDEIIENSFETLNEFHGLTIGRAVVQIAPAEVYSETPPVIKNSLIGLAAGFILGVAGVFFKNLNS